MKRFYIIILAQIISISAFARYTYEIKNNEAYVVNTDDYWLDDEIILPDFIKKDGVSYPVVGIGSSAFKGADIVTIKLPATLKYIGVWAFAFCDNIKEITIPNSVTFIDTEAFYKCENLTKVVFSNCNPAIEKGCFYGCRKLKYVTLGTGISTISDEMFSGCTNLLNSEIIKMLRQVKTIGFQAFHHCDGLTSLIIPDNVTFIDAFAFSSSDNLEYVKIGNGIKYIEIGMFDSCDKLSEVIVGDNVTTIKEAAFNNCKQLTTMVWGKSLQYIDCAFRSSSSLVSITCYAKTPPKCCQWGLPFLPRKSILTIQVPRESLNAYKTAYQWNEFAEYITAIQ